MISALDNTIRYSNPGIRDIQHGAAFQFTNLITYDALYYKSTDAAAYYEALGDIVGGIGSYPVLSSPHYHQTHDVLENMNHQLITEVAKTTAATLAPPGVEPVAAHGPEGRGGERWQGDRVVEAQPRDWRHGLSRLIRPADRSRTRTNYASPSQQLSCPTSHPAS